MSPNRETYESYESGATTSIPRKSTRALLAGATNGAFRGIWEVDLAGFDLQPYVPPICWRHKELHKDMSIKLPSGKHQSSCYPQHKTQGVPANHAKEEVKHKSNKHKVAKSKF